MSDTFYITTPIYYVNDVPHIGHAYTTVACDTMARYMRMRGKDVFFLTGTDEHGQKVEKTASAKGISNKEFVDSVAPRFKELLSVLNASNTGFIRTTETRHIEAVKHIFKVLLDKGDIYKGEYEDWYCVPCESFWTTLQLKDEKCPDCGRAVEKLKEESYFFRLSKPEYQEKLLRHIEENPEFISPTSRKNEIVSFINSGLRDLSVSRTSFTWGIPVPGDERHVIYVWLDALTNYLSALGYPAEGGDYAKYWREGADIVHVIGKDILRFHAVYWPMFLIAAGLPLPKRIFAHGWWTIAGEKMSKSKGNVVDPFAVVEELDRHGVGVDGFRYFLLREVPFGLDGDYSRDAMVGRINSDLANDLGNLHFRTINMIEKYLGGEIPVPNYDIDEKILPFNVYEPEILGLFRAYKAQIEKMSFSEAIQTVWKMISDANRLIDTQAPWALAKSDLEKDSIRLKNVLGTACQVLKASAVMLYPIMPEKMEMIWKQLGHSTLIANERIIVESTFWRCAEGQRIMPGPRVAPFPRIETERIKAMKAASEKGEKKVGRDAPGATKAQSTPTLPSPLEGGGSEGGGLIKIDDFMKVDLRVGKVLDAERVPKSDKLIKMLVDIGTEVRQIVGGIGKAYHPQELVGKTVVVVANLKPAKLMGIESQGMLLAAGDPDTLKLAGFEADVSPGTKVK